MKIHLNLVKIFIENYNEDDEGFILDADVQYPETLHEIHNDLPVLPERMKIEKVEKPVANLHDQKEYVIDLRNINKH